MSSPPRNRLWDPSAGIRFSPKTDRQPRYPSLDISRFVHTPGPKDDTTRKLQLDSEEFSDDEEFEKNAAEWFDQQDLLASTAPAAEEFQVISDAEGNPIDPKPEAEAETETEAIKKISPPVTCLDFNIDPEKHEAAQNSKKGTDESFWSYTMYQRAMPDGELQKVKVHYCTSKHTMEHVCKTYFEDEKVLGFDLEWMTWARKPHGPRANVSLIQLASPSRIGLFHVALFRSDDFVAPTFKKIMEDESVTKVGVAIKGDCTRLKTHLGVETKGIFELSHMYKLVKYSKLGQYDRINKSLISLAIQAEEFFGLPLYKGDSVRSSNWMAPLSAKQVTYSASDAYAGLNLFYVLDQERQKLDPCPPRPEFAEKGLPIKFLTAEDVDESDVILDQDSETSAVVEVDLTNVEVEAELEEPVAVSPPPVSIPAKQPQARDSRIIAAEKKVQECRAAREQANRIMASALRTYFLWYDNEDLSPESIAKLLRTPPLQTGTIVSYIMDAIVVDHRPFSKSRLRNEVLVLLAPDAMRRRPKYQALIDETREAT
ncbi:3'-5' exonuclease domain-containing protein [Fusarium sp. LHS14.1]|nr:3'-5' exonuclease domain-containing protein [Fusarium sp. LHS14.1]